MKLKTEDIEQYQVFFNRKREEEMGHTTKFMIDDKTIECSTGILTRHSPYFQGKDTIFLLLFTGQLEKVYDILELMHGHDVPIHISNVEAIAKFGTFYQCQDLIEVAERWIEEEIVLARNEDTISNIAKIVLNIFKMGHTKIIFNPNIRDPFVSNTDIIMPKLTDSYITAHLIPLYFILEDNDTHQHNLPPITQNIDNEQTYKSTLETINKIIEVSTSSILNAKRKHIHVLLKKGAELVTTKDIVHLHCEVERRFKRLKFDMPLMGKVEVLNADRIIESGEWKSYTSWQDILKLKGVHDMTEFQYFEIVLYFLITNQSSDEDTKTHLRSSIDMNLCDMMFKFLVGRETEDNEVICNSKYKNEDMCINKYSLISRSDELTVFKCGKYNEIHIENVRGKPRIVCKDDPTFYLHWFSGRINIVFDFSCDEGLSEEQIMNTLPSNFEVEYVDYNSIVAESYESFVDKLIAGIKHHRDTFYLWGVTNKR